MGVLLRFLSASKPDIPKMCRSYDQVQTTEPEMVSMKLKQGKSEGFDSCDRPSHLTQMGFKSSTFQLVWPWNLMDDLEKPLGMPSLLCQALYIISNPLVNSNWSYSPETLNSSIMVKISDFFVLCDLEILWMTLRNNRALLLYSVKLCALFQSHQWIKTGVTVWKHSIWVKIGDFLPHVTLKFNRWPWKPIGHLFYIISTFVHHFVTIGEFKLELQSGNA